MAQGNSVDYEKVLLANVSVLSFTRGQMTLSRRTKPIPQLICDDKGTGGCPLRGLFRTAMCKNQGMGDDGQPRWECWAELPAELAIKEVEVSCEGFDAPDDPYVLVGSCSLTYSLDDINSGYQDSGFTFAHVILVCFVCVFISRLLRSWRRARQAVLPPPPGYDSLPLEDSPLPPAPVMVTGKPVLPTAVPLDDAGVQPPSSEQGPTEDSTSRAAVGGEAGAGDSLPSAVAVEVPRDSVRDQQTVEAAQFRPRRMEDLEIPVGWEERIDPIMGRSYFIDHRHRITTWNDPRASMWQQYQARDLEANQAGVGLMESEQDVMPRGHIRSSNHGVMLPLGIGALGGFVLGRSLRRVGGFPGPLPRPGLAGGGFGRFPRGFRGGGGFGGGGMGGLRSGFGGTANR